LNICIFSFHAVKENLRQNPARASTVHSGAHRAQAQISRRANSLLLQHHRLSIVDILRNRSIDSRGDRRQRPYPELAGQDSAEESALFVLVAFCSLLHGLATQSCCCRSLLPLSGRPHPVRSRPAPPG
jgi:hypothetical protein